MTYKSTVPSLPPSRMFCTRRLRRIRRSLHFTQGHRNRYHKKTLTTETVGSVRSVKREISSLVRPQAFAQVFVGLEEPGHETITSSV